MNMDYAIKLEYAVEALEEKVKECEVEIDELKIANEKILKQIECLDNRTVFNAVL